MKKRFLNNNDYLSDISSYHLEQISDGFDLTQFEKAERVAKDRILENMSDNYEIDTAIAIGENIADYNTDINYPMGVFFNDGEFIVKTLRKIKGVQYPIDGVYWREDIDLTSKEEEEYIAYSQLEEFYETNKVVYQGKYYTCMITNGFAFNKIVPPDMISNWVELTSLTEEEQAEIVDFDKTKNDYIVGDKVKYSDKYFEASGDVNFTTPTYGTNIKKQDPRPSNIINHMVKISLYQLAKSISPKNVSSMIFEDYKDSLQWLRDCNKLKINPGVPRKVDSEGNVSKDWAIATFSPNTSGNHWMV